MVRKNVHLYEVTNAKHTCEKPCAPRATHKRGAPSTHTLPKCKHSKGGKGKRDGAVYANRDHGAASANRGNRYAAANKTACSGGKGQRGGKRGQDARIAKERLEPTNTGSSAAQRGHGARSVNTNGKVTAAGHGKSQCNAATVKRGHGRRGGNVVKHNDCAVDDIVSRGKVRARCFQHGHRARDCMAPAPAPRKRSPSTSSAIDNEEVCARCLEYDHGANECMAPAPVPRPPSSPIRARKRASRKKGNTGSASYVSSAGDHDRQHLAKATISKRWMFNKRVTYAQLNSSWKRSRSQPQNLPCRRTPRKRKGGGRREDSTTAQIKANCAALKLESELRRDELLQKLKLEYQELKAALAALKGPTPGVFA